MSILTRPQPCADLIRVGLPGARKHASFCHPLAVQMKAERRGCKSVITLLKSQPWLWSVSRTLPPSLCQPLVDLSTCSPPNKCPRLPGTCSICSGNEKKKKKVWIIGSFVRQKKCIISSVTSHNMWTEHTLSLSAPLSGFNLWRSSFVPLWLAASRAFFICFFLSLS